MYHSDVIAVFPDILLSGHEAKIKEWELQQSLERTRRLRPDLLGE